MVVDEDYGKIGGHSWHKGCTWYRFGAGYWQGYTSNGDDAWVTIFDMKTLKPLSTVKVTGKNPDSILCDPATKRIFTFNGGSANATAIEAITENVVGTIALGGYKLPSVTI
jgi:hypothetical protein